MRQAVSSVLKWLFVAVAVFAIATAEPEQRSKMYDGAKAFGLAVVSACRRPGSPCTEAIASAKAIVVALLERASGSSSEEQRRESIYQE